jgi:hypothetical protein
MINQIFFTNEIDDRLPTMSTIIVAETAHNATI